MPAMSAFFNGSPRRPVRPEQKKIPAKSAYCSVRVGGGQGTAPTERAWDRLGFPGRCALGRPTLQAIGFCCMPVPTAWAMVSSQAMNANDGASTSDGSSAAVARIFDIPVQNMSRQDVLDEIGRNIAGAR